MQPTLRPGRRRGQQLVLDRFRGEEEGCGDGLSGQMRILAANLLGCPATGEEPEQELDGDPGTADDGLPGDDRRIGRDVVLPAHRTSEAFGNR